MADMPRQFQGTKNPDGGYSITQAEPVDTSKRNMVKFNKANPVHMELIRSLGDSAPHSANTMKGENIMLHSGGYFSTAKDEAPAKTEGKEKPTKAVAEKRTYTKKTTKKAAPEAPKKTKLSPAAPTKKVSFLDKARAAEAAAPAPKTAAPTSAPKKGGALAAARAAEDAARKRGDLKR